MAQYPSEIYTPRSMVNRPGAVYDSNLTKVIFAEDFNFDRAEIVAIQTVLGLNPSSSYDTVASVITPLVDTGVVSAGVISGFDYSDNGDGSIDVSSGVSLLRVSDSESAEIVRIEFPGVSDVSLADGATNYVYFDYNSGEPAIVVSSSISSFNCMDKCLVYTIAREGNSIFVVDARGQNVDSNRKHRRVLLECDTFRHISGGCIIGEASGRKITVTAGGFYYGLNRIDHPAFDTSGSDTFAYYYRNGSGGFTKTTGNTVIDNAYYDDGSGTLASLGNNKFGVFWVYLLNNDPSSLAVQYGQESYNTIADAEASSVPLAPSTINGVGVLIGRIIIQKSASSFTSIETSFARSFVPSSAVSHNSLAVLQGGSVNEYYHFSALEHTYLQKLSTNSLSLVKATRQSYQSIPSDTFTKVELNIVSIDSEDEYDPDTNYRFTANSDGVYRVGALITSAGETWSVGKVAQINIYKNGANFALLDLRWLDAIGTRNLFLNGTTIIQLSAGDYLELYFKHTLGSNINIAQAAERNILTVERIR